MNNIWGVVLLGIVLPFAVVNFFGAPYVPTKKRIFLEFLKSLKLGKNKKLLDLGSGDGTVLIEATRKQDFYSVGYEMNPLLVWITRLRTLRDKERITVTRCNFWHTTIPDDIDVIYAFVLPKYMGKLEKKIENEISKPIIVITYAFDFPNHKHFKKLEGFMAFHFEPLAK